MLNIGLIVYYLCMLIAVCHGTLPMSPEKFKEISLDKGTDLGKIVGGEPVNRCTTYPFQVSIQRKSLMTTSSSHFCGGSIINPDFVLTASHCVNGRSPPQMFVVVGTHELDSNGRNGIRRNVANITVHEKYNSKETDYDIALIKLERPLDLSSECVKPVGLPKQDEDIELGAICHATGWGRISEGGSSSTTLRVVGVPIVSQEDCKKSYGEDDITPRMICAGLQDGGKDACQGDSGGALTFRGMQVGITSWGYGCARPNLYGVYTRVSRFRDWIDDQISKYE